MKKVLIVEDDMIIALSTQKMVQKIGHKVIGRVTTGEEAVQEAVHSKPDVILMDIRLAGNIDGIDASSLILKSVTDTDIIYTTGNTDQSYLERAGKTGYKAFLVKPVSMIDLKKSFE
ncbi:MAG: response regulator [Balneolaceae bacterium]